MDKLNPKNLAFSSHCFQNTPPSPVWLSPRSNDMLKSDSFTIANKSNPSNQLFFQNVTPESQISRISYNYSNSQHPTSTYNKSDHNQKNKGEQNRLQYNSQLNYYKTSNAKWQSYSRQFLKKPLEHLINRIFHSFMLIKKSSRVSGNNRFKRLFNENGSSQNDYAQNQELSEVYPLEMSSNDASINRRGDNSPIRKICGIQLTAKVEKNGMRVKNKVKVDVNPPVDLQQDLKRSQNIALQFLSQNKNVPVLSIKLNEASYQQIFEPTIASNVSLPIHCQRFNQKIQMQDEEIRDRGLDEIITNFNQINLCKRGLIKLGGFIGNKKQEKQRRRNQPEQLKSNKMVQIKMDQVVPSLQMDYQIPENKKRMTGTSTPQQLTSIPRERIIFNQNSMNNIIGSKYNHLGIKNQPKIIRFTVNPEAPRNRNQVNIQETQKYGYKTNQFSQNNIVFKTQHLIQTPKNMTPQKSFNLSNSSKNNYKIIQSPNKIITQIPNQRSQYKNIQSYYQVYPQHQQLNQIKTQRPIRIEQPQHVQLQHQHPRYKSLYNLQRPSSYSHQNIQLAKEVIKPIQNIKLSNHVYHKNNIYMLPSNQMHKSVSERQITNRPPPNYIKTARPYSYKPLSVDHRMGNGTVMRQRTPDRQIWIRRDGRVGNQSQTLLDYGI